MSAVAEEILSAREDLQEAYLAAWNSHDPDTIASFFAPGAVYDDRGAAEIAHGPEGVRAHAARVFVGFPDLHFEIVRVAHGEDYSCGEWRATMTHSGELFGLSATGRRLQTAGTDLATYGDDGLIAHLVSYYDGADVMRQLGMLPARHSRVEQLFVKTVSLVPRRRA